MRHKPSSRLRDSYGHGLLRTLAPAVGAVKQLAKKSKETVVGHGLTKGDKSAMELFVSRKGTWTLVVTNTKKEISGERTKILTKHVSRFCFELEYELNRE